MSSPRNDLRKQKNGSHKTDWDHWRLLPQVELWQAVALAVGENPAILNRDHPSEKYSKLLNIAMAHATAGTLVVARQEKNIAESQLLLTKFVPWAEGLPVPVYGKLAQIVAQKSKHERLLPLYAAAQALADRIEDMRTYRPISEKAGIQLKSEIEELRKERIRMLATANGFDIPHESKKIFYGSAQKMYEAGSDGDVFFEQYEDLPDCRIEPLDCFDPYIKDHQNDCYLEDQSTITHADFLKICTRKKDDLTDFGGYRVQSNGLYVSLSRKTPFDSKEEALKVGWHPTGEYAEPALPFPCTLGQLRQFALKAGLCRFVEVGSDCTFVTSTFVDRLATVTNVVKVSNEVKIERSAREWQPKDSLQRAPGYRWPLYQLLLAAHRAGEPCPNPRQVLEAWTLKPHPDLQIMSDSLKYSDGKGNTREANLKAIGQAIKNLQK